MIECLFCKKCVFNYCSICKASYGSDYEGSRCVIVVNGSFFWIYISHNSISVYNYMNELLFDMLIGDIKSKEQIENKIEKCVLLL